MAPVLLFLTGVLSGLIAGYFLALMLRRNEPGAAGNEQRILRDQLGHVNEQQRLLQTQLDEQRQLSAAAQVEAAENRTRASDLSTQVAELKSQLHHAESALEHHQSQAAEYQASLARVSEQLRSQEEQSRILFQARTDLQTQFEALSARMLKESREQLITTNQQLVAEPFRVQMQTLQKRVEDLQQASLQRLEVLQTTTRDLIQKSEDVQGAALQLTSALKSPNIKGQWGEVNLRRILEFVGLLNYCDFEEQVSVAGENRTYRPDCIITIPGERRLIIDAKAPLESYLSALQATDEVQRQEALKAHLKKVKTHIDNLSRKDYVKQISRLGQVVDGVLLFIPVEGALSMALEQDPGLLEYAFERRIILTFPTSLLAILKGLAMTIQQQEIARNVEEIRQSAMELYQRFDTFAGHFSKVANRLSQLNSDFNAAVGSYNVKLLPQARKLAALGGRDMKAENLEQLEQQVREPKMNNGG